MGRCVGDSTCEMVLRWCEWNLPELQARAVSQGPSIDRILVCKVLCVHVCMFAYIFLEIVPRFNQIFKERQMVKND